MQNILYIHGFGSANANNPKVKMLEQFGTVYGIDLDYTLPYETVLEKVKAAVKEHHIDFLVGTSMGGYMAAMAGEVTDTPFIALNPSPSPSTTLKRFVGLGTDYTGRDYIMTEEVTDTYPPITKQGTGLVLLEEGDEVLSVTGTLLRLGDAFTKVVFKGGNHRFQNLSSAAGEIDRFIIAIEMAQGFDEN